MLQVKNISFKYDSKMVLSDVSFDLCGGQSLGILGPSGCGKTTLLRALAGLAKPHNGSIHLDGNTLLDCHRGVNLSPRLRRIGMLFQNYALFPHLSVYENIAFGLDHLSSQEKKERILSLALQLYLTPFLDAYPNKLSGGQQQRVALARCLAPRPSLVLLDEPFAALDSHLRDMARKWLTNTLETESCSIILVSHDIKELFLSSNYLMIMGENGLIVEQGPTQNILSMPKHATSAKLLGYSIQILMQRCPQNGRLRCEFGWELTETDILGMQCDSYTVYVPPFGLLVHKQEAKKAVACTIKRLRHIGHSSYLDIVPHADPTTILRCEIQRDISLYYNQVVYVGLDMQYVCILPTPDPLCDNMGLG